MTHRTNDRQPKAPALTHEAAPPAHLPGEFLVRFRPAALRAAITFTRGPRDGFEAHRIAAASSQALLMNHLHDRFGLRSVEPVFTLDPLHALASRFASWQRALARTVGDALAPGGEGFAILRFPDGPGTDPRRLDRLLRNSEEIDLVEPVPARWLSAPRRPDPALNRQWGLRAIRHFGARRTSAHRVPVAVIDSGIDRHHPLLPDSVVTRYDHDGLSPDDLEGHGTHVAGTIAALCDDLAGCSGIANCPLQVWKVIDDRPMGDGRRYVAFAQYLRALAAVETSGARVLNLSLGGTASSQTETRLFRRLRAADVFVVAAMGNERELGDPVEYPAAYPGVHGVAAVDELDRDAPFSNTGRHAFLSAPGVNIVSTVPTSARPGPPFDTSSGTSMATPHVAAVAALVRARHPDWDVAQVAAHLAATARPAAGQRAGKRSNTFGHGIVNQEDALR